jgi:hypothetical protein
MSNRSATDTIKGYFYQFDYSIEQLFSLANDTDEITVEGIEDVDIESSTESTAVQCKYYSKSEYNHSVISKPLRLMLNHFRMVKNGTTPQIKYHLYGHYNSGQSKLTLPLTVDFLKDKFLTYKSDGIQNEHHTVLALSDSDLQEFLDLLSIDINAKSYSQQFQDIIATISASFSCDTFEAEYYFYNNALNEIRKLAIESDVNDRKITKRDFIDRINNKQVLFNKWFLELKGNKIYHKELKDKHFRTLNKSPFERFFLIELPPNYSINDAKEMIHIVSKRYSNLKKREPQTYCPYIYFGNISDSDLLSLKNQLYNEDFTFIDGIPYLGANFSIKEITKKADFNNQIQIKILNDSTQTNTALQTISKTKQVFQFYFNTPILTATDNGIKNVGIQITNLNHIKEII